MTEHDKHDYEAPLKQIKSLIEQVDDDFDWNGFECYFNGKHIHAIVSALQLAGNRKGVLVPEDKLREMQEKIKAIEEKEKTHVFVPREMGKN